MKPRVEYWGSRRSSRWAGRIYADIERKLSSVPVQAQSPNSSKPAEGRPAVVSTPPEPGGRSSVRANSKPRKRATRLPPTLTPRPLLASAWSLARRRIQPPQRQRADNTSLALVSEKRRTARDQSRNKKNSQKPPAIFGKSFMCCEHQKQEPLKELESYSTQRRGREPVPTGTPATLTSGMPASGMSPP